MDLKKNFFLDPQVSVYIYALFILVLISNCPRMNEIIL